MAAAIFLAVGFAGARAAYAGISSSQAHEIGLTQLWKLHGALTGQRINVGQAEAVSSNSSPHRWGYEPNPGAMASRITYYNCNPVYSSGTYRLPAMGGYSSLYASSHATTVADIFYNGSGSVAPGVAHVDVFDAFSFYNYVLSNNATVANQPAIVNQSFAFTGVSAGQIFNYNYVYDEYANLHNTLFVTAVGDGTGTKTGTKPASEINAPATNYNGIAVAAYGGASGIGQAYGGISKPDITAPGTATSFTAPIISGAAAILEQAANANVGGAGTSSLADNERTIKVLLLNGAVKPAGWTNHYDYATATGSVTSYLAPTAYATTPLDPRYGAGIVNVYNSYQELAGGRQTYSRSTTVTGAKIPAPVFTAASTRLGGWDLNTITTSSSSANTANHYVFNLSATRGSSFGLTATIAWNMQTHKSILNNLALYLYNTSGRLLASCTSKVDNVQQIEAKLAPGIYDMEVVKLGAAEVSAAETYALAYNFTPMMALRLTSAMAYSAVRLAPTVVPDPATWATLGVGMGLLLLRRRRC
ncbi:MAG: hypothetical protein HKL95_01380 [Phycisphaerae bacterium]|nr:hypothetical protein [Phycisphaerae bacterium]